MEVRYRRRVGLNAGGNHRPGVRVGQPDVEIPLLVRADRHFDVGTVEVRIVAVLRPVRRVGVAVVDLGGIRLLGPSTVVLHMAQRRPGRRLHRFGLGYVQSAGQWPPTASPGLLPAGRATSRFLSETSFPGFIAVLADEV